MMGGEPQRTGDSRLALHGGDSVVNRAWPRWPAADPETERAVLETLHSGRWAVSGMNAGSPPKERLFGEAFARFLGVDYAVPVSHGSAALVVALEALGVGYGDEVLVPGLTWVACASAVTRVGAVPVIVDVDPETLCMSAEAARAAITPRTRVVLLVHLYSSLADLDAFVSLCAEYRLALLEDCSQAHGARWKGRRVGSFGDIGVFSFQDSKLLTAGEGGVVATSDAALYDAAQQLRADGRRWTSQTTIVGWPDLEEVGAWQGHNYCMSEFQAAVLLSRLERLDEENAHREGSVRALERALAAVDGVELLRSRDASVDGPTFYRAPVRIETDSFGGAPLERIRQAVQAELSVFLEPLDAPLNRNRLYNPLRSRRFSHAHRRGLDPRRFALPVAEAAYATCFTIPHNVFLADATTMDLVAEAFAKVARLSSALDGVPAARVGA